MKKTYIPLIRVGGLRWGTRKFYVFCVGGKANFSIFRYQHVGIANANFRVGPNASSFALQCNIGFTIIFHIFTSIFHFLPKNTQKKNNKKRTFVSGVERGEENHKECGGVFAGVDDVRKDETCVTVTPDTLGEAEPGGETGDQGPDTV